MMDPNEGCLTRMFSPNEYWQTLKNFDYPQKMRQGTEGGNYVPSSMP